MFNGIITEIGLVESVVLLPKGKLFRISSHYLSSTINIGASIAHDGVCLTVVDKSISDHDQWYEVEAWEETLRLTTCGSWQKGHEVNLERPLRIGDEVGGHIVLGHIDGIAKIVDLKEKGSSICYTIETPAELSSFIALKGSICLNGVSLTINSVYRNQLNVLIIPYTQKITTWGKLDIGHMINVEVDVIARYLERLIGLSSLSLPRESD
ncbi:riboflavin synthase [Candidatus Endowatersipora endosymbiont of Watersipora subatra]|uniref:riboflavin synthase n=1 Tax=Candidatus Endowatersipora endosymbiont of Watersipora subatra TaxID=3077946 RepID=UPI00312CBD3B